ncbi:hypothetical protein GALMADRAFT_232988 [Galerina marginata CBS 339.88]|uniref:Uncharacterized protein n=1 Tax=Galerina marginata (strain CBS 339.88) TaxID=685588 RepID=A0A067SEF5_GALM3|nr:hypothetical protein GALMADRAFT_232988 [Galerina marginata CBS 339.88]
MDEHYDLEAAKVALAEILRERTNIHSSKGSNVQLAHANISEFQVSEFAKPRSWRLTEFSAESAAMEEVVVRIQGVICAKMLPPVSKPPNLGAMTRQRPYIRQAATITGLGSEAFNKLHENIELIFMAFANTFPADSLDGWQGSGFNGLKAVDFHARYFDRRGPATDESEDIPFSPLEDPEEVLAGMVGDGFFHGRDNAVNYVMRSITREGMVRYSPISPASIRIGDIVEVSASFVVFPCRDNRYKMVPLLRGILLLNQEARDVHRKADKTTYAQKAAILRMRSRFIPAPTPVLVSKRKPLYTDEEAVDETQRRMSRMNIGQ